MKVTAEESNYASKSEVLLNCDLFAIFFLIKIALLDSMRAQLLCRVDMPDAGSDKHFSRRAENDSNNNVLHIK